MFPRPALLRLAAVAAISIVAAPIAATAGADVSRPVMAEQAAGRPEAAPEDERQKQRVQIAFLLLAGVGFVGLALLGLVVLWGFRLRRIARAPLPDVAEVDPLWYLRPGKGASGPPDPEGPAQPPDDAGAPREG